MPRKAKETIQCETFEWNLFRRNGVWYADARSHPALGKASLGTRDRTEALANLRRLDRLKAIDLGLIAPSTAPGQPLSIPAGWDRFLEFCERSRVQGGVGAGTSKRYRSVRKHQERYCRRRGIATWNEFDKQALIRYGQAREYGAEATEFLELNLLKGMVKFFIEEGLLPAACRIHLRLTRPTETNTYCYTREQFAAMLDFCRNDAGLIWLEPILLTLGMTGMRIGEAANLRWSDIDFAANVLRVADESSNAKLKKKRTARQTKGRRSRMIPLHPRLKETLFNLPRSADGFVLHAMLGGKINVGNLRAVFVERVLTPLAERFPTPEDEIGFIDGRLHSFRHFFCSETFRSGASEGEIRAWLGHTDSRITARYRHLQIADAVDRMSRIDFLGAASEQVG